MTVGIILLLLCALLTTQFTLTWRLLPATVGIIMSTIMFSLLGRILTTKSVVTVAQLLFLTLAFAGGVLIPPALMPERLNHLSQLLPSRAARDLIVDVGLGNSIGVGTAIGVSIWILVFGVANLIVTKNKHR